MNPKITLIEWTLHPAEVIYVLWQASRTDDQLLSVDDVKKAIIDDPRFKERVYKVFDEVVGASIPVSEAVRFTFMFENITVAWREQLVRHRTNSYWSQSSRARPLSEFYKEEIYWTPPEVYRSELAFQHWDECMNKIDQTYNALERLGISRDNARGVLPQYMTHRISGTFTLRHLAELIKARTCWIAQSDLWVPVIQGMLSEIAIKVDVRLSQLLGSPPCARGGEYYHCPIGPDNEHRLKAEDPEPPCPLWLAQIGHAGNFWRQERATELMERFGDVWHPNLVQVAQVQMRR